MVEGVGVDVVFGSALVVPPALAAIGGLAVAAFQEATTGIAGFLLALVAVVEADRTAGNDGLGSDARQCVVQG